MRIADAQFRVAGPCERCSLTTVDPETGDKGSEPLKTLAGYRRIGGRVRFGVNLVAEAGALGRTLRVGDPVSVS